MLALNCGHTMKICSCAVVNSRMCESNRQTYEVENIKLLLIIYGISLSGMSMNLLQCLLKLLVIDFRAEEIILIYSKKGKNATLWSFLTKVSFMGFTAQWP